MSLQYNKHVSNEKLVNFILTKRNIVDVSWVNELENVVVDHKYARLVETTINQAGEITNIVPRTKSRLTIHMYSSLSVGSLS